MTRMRKRSRKPSLSSGAVIVFALVLMAGVTGVTTEPYTAPVDTCADGVDNDEDGFNDFLDSECDPMSQDYDGNENGIIGS